MESAGAQTRILEQQRRDSRPAAGSDLQIAARSRIAEFKPGAGDIPQVDDIPGFEVFQQRASIGGGADMQSEICGIADREFVGWRVAQKFDFTPVAQEGRDFQ